MVARSRCGTLEDESKFWASEEKRKETTNASLEKILSEEGGKEAVN